MTNNINNKNKKILNDKIILYKKLIYAIMNTTFLCAAPPKEQQHNQQLPQFTEGTTEANHYPQDNNSTVQQNNA